MKTHKHLDIRCNKNNSKTQIDCFHTTSLVIHYFSSNNVSTLNKVSKITLRHFSTESLTRFLVCPLRCLIPLFDSIVPTYLHIHPGTYHKKTKTYQNTLVLFLQIREIISKTRCFKHHFCTFQDFVSF